MPTGTCYYDKTDVEYDQIVGLKRTVILLFMQSLDSTLRFRCGFLGNVVSSSPGTGKVPTPDILESAQLTKEYAEIVDGRPLSLPIPE